MPNLIYTYATDSEAEATRELRKYGLKHVRRLEGGVGLAAGSAPWTETAAKFVNEPPVWVRHVHPVHVSAPIRNDGRDFLVYEALLEPALMDLDTAGTFSVQVRLLGDEVRWQYSRVDISERLAAVVAGWGTVPDVRDPFQVVSVTCTPTDAYLGISRAQDNLSSWAGGERRYKREEGQVSRAEFKLLEAFEVFRIDLPPAGRALDLGAAPGGWTRVLAGRGLHVTAVDPAELDPRVAALPAVRHVRKLVQDVKFSEPFDVIVNDMRMDARDAARVLSMLYDYLKPDGVLLMTLKLPERGKGETAEAALDILSRRYNIIGARQLFHNRSEITVAATRR